MPKDSLIYHTAFYDVAFVVTAGAFNSFAYVEKVLVNQRRYANATTYINSNRTSRSVNNGLYILAWSIKHYREARSKALYKWKPKLELLNSYHLTNPLALESKRILELQIKEGPLAFLLLQYHFLKDYKYLFRTKGGGIVKMIRALLYPIMQYYQYR